MFILVRWEGATLAWAGEGIGKISSSLQLDIGSVAIKGLWQGHGGEDAKAESHDIGLRKDCDGRPGDQVL